jgi:hypothetical protein
MYCYTTNWFNVEVNRNYTPLEPQPYQIWNSFGVIENTYRTYFDNINHEVSEL